MISKELTVITQETGNVRARKVYQTDRMPGLLTPDQNDGLLLVVVEPLSPVKSTNASRLIIPKLVNVESARDARLTVTTMGLAAVQSLLSSLEPPFIASLVEDEKHHPLLEWMLDVYGDPNGNPLEDNTEETDFPGQYL